MATKNAELYYLHRPVANLAAIKAIETSGIAAPITLECVTLGIFYYNSTSSATPDDINIIQPTVGPGRWIRFDTTNANIYTAVQYLNAGVQISSAAYVSGNAPIVYLGDGSATDNCHFRAGRPAHGVGTSSVTSTSPTTTSGTIPLIGETQTWTGTQTFNNAIVVGGAGIEITNGSNLQFLGNTLYYSAFFIPTQPTILSGLGNLSIITPTPTANVHHVPYLETANTWAGVQAFPNTTSIGGSGITITSPVTSQVLSYDGSQWVNSDAAVSVTGITSYYLSNTDIIPAGTQNALAVKVLTKAPPGGGETTISATVNNNTVAMACYLYNTAIEGTTFDAGVWLFNTWLAASITSGTAEIIINSYDVREYDSHITLTGTGTSRTATVDEKLSEAVFVPGDANANITIASYLQTPNGCFQITGYTSLSTVTVATPSTYTNETHVSFWKHIKCFGMTSSPITHASFTNQIVSSTQNAFTIIPLDLYSIRIFATTTNVDSTIVSFTTNGTARASIMSTPITTRHNSLQGLQGGIATQYYHVNTNEYAAINLANTPSQINVFATMADLAGHGYYTAGAGLYLNSTVFSIDYFYSNHWTVIQTAPAWRTTSSILTADSGRKYVERWGNTKTSVTTYTTFFTITPSTVTALYYAGAISVTASGYSAGVWLASGVYTGKWAFYYNNGVPTVEEFASDKTGVAPLFQLTVSGNNILVQAASCDASAVAKVSMYMDTLIPIDYGEITVTTAITAA